MEDEDVLQERRSERQVRRAPAMAGAMAGTMPPRTATEPSLGLAGRRRVCFRTAQTSMAGSIARELRGGMRKSTASFHNAHSPIRKASANTLLAPSIILPSLLCAFIAAIIALTISKV